MTGQCYYCAAGEHHECYGEACTCCGERNAKHNKDVAALVLALRDALIATGFYLNRLSKENA